MVYLIGAGGHAKVIIEILERLGHTISGLEDPNSTVKLLLDYKVHNSLPRSFNQNTDKVIISIGDNMTRKKVASSTNYLFCTAIHPCANISERSFVGHGTVIMAGATVNSSVIIGKHVIINTNSSVDHDCVVEDFVHVSPNAAVAGGVHIGEGTQIGLGACVIQNVSIGKWCVIGAGAVVIKDVPDGCVVVGNPGRIIRSVDI